MTMYTELLEAAMKTAQACEKSATTPEERKEWQDLNKACRKEMYNTRGKIDALRKKERDE